MMATINKRKDQDGNTRYQVIVRLKGHPTQTATFTRITDAKKWAQHTEAAIREGRYFKTVEAKRHTLGGMIDRYIELFHPSSPRKAQLEWWKSKIGSYVLCDITPAMIAAVRDELLQGISKLHHHLLFPGKVPGKPMDLRKAWIAALKQADIKDFRFHDLRHSAASYMAMSGCNLVEIGILLGHKRLEVTFLDLSSDGDLGYSDNLETAITKFIVLNSAGTTTTQYRGVFNRLVKEGILDLQASVGEFEVK